jgi:hypothetical protein
MLIEQSILGAGRSKASIAAAILSVVASILVCVLSHYEHNRSFRPSPVLILFLALTILFEAARTRTYFLLGVTALAATLSISIAFKVLLLTMESQNKKRVLMQQHQTKTLEELAGPINRTFFQWLNGLMLRGYRGLLAAADIGPIDSRLYSARLRIEFSPIDRQIYSRSTLMPLKTPLD